MNSIFSVKARIVSYDDNDFLKSFEYLLKTKERVSATKFTSMNEVL